ncbi:MAG: GGDEF domain-containing protein [Rickettsiales bacterium]
MAQSNTAKNKRNLSPLFEEALSLYSPLNKKSSISERIRMLGIPESDLSEHVILAISAIFEKMDDLNIELNQAREHIKEIESLVDVDVLAPIPNRRAFMRRLSWVISMQERYGHPSSILYFDLNDFKNINDTYGHAAGDMAIRHVASLLTSMKRESDFLARIGGDEFAVILYYASEEDARKRAMTIAEKLRNTPFLFNNRPLTVTSAVGIHTIHKGETAEDALSKADLSMFENKKQTRGSLAVDA